MAWSMDGYRLPSTEHCVHTKKGTAQNQSSSPVQRRLGQGRVVAGSFFTHGEMCMRNGVIRCTCVHDAYMGSDIANSSTRLYLSVETICSSRVASTHGHAHTICYWIFKDSTVRCGTHAASRQRLKRNTHITKRRYNMVHGVVMDEPLQRSDGHMASRPAPRNQHGMRLKEL